MDPVNSATHEDAQLILKLYELRREEKMRLARDWYLKEFFPTSLDDIKAILNPHHPGNAYFRMVVSYWDMAASFVVHGALHAELFLESGNEMLFVWAKLVDFVPTIRKDFVNPNFLRNVEKAIERVSWAAERVRSIQERLPLFREMLTEPTKS